jgi:hypothetical protein
MAATMMMISTSSAASARHGWDMALPLFWLFGGATSSLSFRSTRLLSHAAALPRSYTLSVSRATLSG